MSFFVLSIDGSASIANRHRTVQDKKTLKDRPSLSLVCVYYHLSKMCQWPRTKHPVSVFIQYPRKSKPTERIETQIQPISALPRPSTSRFPLLTINDITFFLARSTKNEEYFLIY